MLVRPIAPPPWIYVLRSTILEPRNNPSPQAQNLNDVELLTSFHHCFKGSDEEINYVDFTALQSPDDVMRITLIRRAGGAQREAGEAPIHR